MNNELFQGLFVLEIANNHWGDVNRGIRIIREYADVIKKNNVKAAIKLQVRDVDTFIHKNYLSRTEVDARKDKEVTSAPGSSSRYIKKTIATRLKKDEFQRLVNEIKKHGITVMLTPFDENSVDLCLELGVEILKIASHDASDWPLVEKIASAQKPTIVSDGGATVGELDRLVNYFKDKGIPLAINRCVSLYPSEDGELELNQIDFLKKRYPEHVIGFSTHEYHDWHSSILIAYGKGARTFERHVDIEADGIPVSKYCSLPHQIDEWFKAYLKAKEMCGKETSGERIFSIKEQEYIKSVSRGIYALRDLPKGYIIHTDGLGKDFYFAVPLLENQYSSHDIDERITLSTPVKKDNPILKM